MADITPAIPEGRQLIQGYGNGGFRIAGAVWKGSVIVLPTRTYGWAVAAYEEVSVNSMPPVTDNADAIEILLIGCGARIGLPSPVLRDAFRPLGIAIDLMDTGAACRTFNVLLSEDRAVAAALIAVE